MRVQMHCIGLYEDQRKKLELLANGRRNFSKVVRRLIDEAAASQGAMSRREHTRQTPIKNTSAVIDGPHAGVNN